jgi:ABC-type multidrug transport system fused ATPase/permease subunit
MLHINSARVKIINEVLSGIRIIKFYAWEKPFGKEVDKIREKELEALTTLAYVSNIGFSVVLMSAPIVQPILVFLTYIFIQDEPLTPAKAFTTVALFNIMRFPFALLPMGLLQYIQSTISLRRLTAYLLLPELEQITLPEPPPASLDGSPETLAGSITMTNCSFCWVDPNASHEIITGEKKPTGKQLTINEQRTANGNESAMADLAPKFPSEPAILKDISITIEAGSLVAVVGAVGSGKSSFLSAIFGEMEPLNGSKVYMPRQGEHEGDGNFLAFCNQTPWVINDTVRGNIVFGRAFNYERYRQVVEACALVDDLAILPAGDMTEIGERGINLSGGQKARISLARALYSPKTKVILLDDPLSAVDSHVGEHLFTEAINGDLLQGTTRVLVTHHVRFLPRCDIVVVLEDGRIKYYGTYADLVARGVDFAGAVDVPKKFKEETSELGQNTIVGESSEGPSATEADTSYHAKTDKIKSGQNLIREEEHTKGSVGLSSYFHYAKAGGIFAAVLTLSAQGLSRALDVGAYFWLAYWSSESAKATLSHEQVAQSKTLEFLGIYALLGLCSVFCIATRGALLAFHRCRACRVLHSDLMASILRAPISFFDVTPTGRILNRFAYDTDKVDLDLK